MSSTAPPVPLESPAGFSQAAVLRKIPHVTATFWVMKIFATTLGETGGDLLSMKMDLGYAVASTIFIGFFLVTVAIQL